MCHRRPISMAEPRILRAYSQSSRGSTLVGSHGSTVSPLASSPVPTLDYSMKETFSPVIQVGPDNRQWIDLEYVSPKLLRELRRQSAISSGFDTQNSLAKGAAKVKAWVRQNKKGIDIRLRRRTGHDRDEITDICLVPHSTSEHGDKPGLEQYPDFDQKDGLTIELPETQDCLIELPDTSVMPELPQRRPSIQRSDSSASSVEGLPRYEPPQRASERADEDGSEEEASEQDPSHRRAPSGTSIMPTPTRGLSVHKPYVDMDAQETETKTTAPRMHSLQASLYDTKRRLAAEREQREHFEQLVAALKRRVSNQEDASDVKNEETPSAPILRNFLVAKSSSYETETDAEPQSPVATKDWPSVRPPKKSNPKSKRSKKKSKSLSGLRSMMNELSDSEIDQPAVHAQSKATIHDSNTTEFGAEAAWSHVLDAQTKMLGAEHPEIYSARHSLALSRSKQHGNLDKTILDCLHRSKLVGSQTLGDVHPLVLTFSKGLERLSDLVLREPQPEGSKNFMQISEDDPGQSVSRGHSNTSKRQSTKRLRSNEFETYGGRSARSPSISLSPPVSASPSPTGKATKPIVPTITTTFHPASKEPSPISANPEAEAPIHTIFNTHRPPHQPRSNMSVLAGLVFKAATNSTIRSILWLQRTLGPEPPVESGKVRVRWTCACGEQLYDDFIENRAGAARELEAYLNRPRAHTGSQSNPSSPASANSSQIFDAPSGEPPSSSTSWSSYGSTGRSPYTEKSGSRNVPIATNATYLTQTWPPAEPPWLLTCANEDRYTPKLSHIDMARHKITSDKDLALALRSLYFHVNRRWWRSLRLRGLSTIEFVQFEVHQNRFADIRKSPDMPNSSADYEFEPSELMPPVGSRYLLHLFKHPEDYDGELITYLRAPKKRTGRLQIGAGYGISLVEGFESAKVWMLMSVLFSLASLVFGAVWAWKKHDVQGAFGVAAWMCTVAVLAVGWLQACLG